MNMLLFNDSFFTNEVIKQDVKRFSDAHFLENNFFETKEYEDTLNILKQESIDLAFIHISSKKIDAIALLKDINNLNLENLKIVGVTNLFDKEFRFKALKQKVYNYVYQPIDNKEIEQCLIKNLNIDVDSTQEVEDDFFDFDEFDDGFDEDDNQSYDQKTMDRYNQSHQNVSAIEFLKEYKEEELNIEDLQDLEESLDKLVSDLLFEDNLENNLEKIIALLDQYQRFLYTFVEFEELRVIIENLVVLLKEIDFENLKREKTVSKFIVAIIQDLVDWKEHLFILQDAVDVYYINASIYNSFVQLKDLINN